MIHRDAAEKSPLKGARRKRNPPSKMCVRCSKVKPLTEFYQNQGWTAQAYRDAWCKACAAGHCVDKDTLREYCWFNHRRWDEATYAMAVAKAQYVLATHPEYIKTGTKRERKEAIENEAITAQFFSAMNLRNTYYYVDNTSHYEGMPPPVPGIYGDDASGDGEMPDHGEKRYDPVWNGMFTSVEIDYLNQYYQKLEEGFVLDNWNIQDYARKISLASLNANSKFNLMRQGICSKR